MGEPEPATVRFHLIGAPDQLPGKARAGLWFSVNISSCLSHLILYLGRLQKLQSFKIKMFTNHNLTTGNVAQYCEYGRRLLFSVFVLVVVGIRRILQGSMSVIKNDTNFRGEYTRIELTIFIFSLTNVF